ncbi:hypothetical protein SETIT_6G191400v2 [Setaria italica]|uniref:Secreted protein n=1 Tax=Setaria italica TaxID=4555 RepID=A0A368RNC5_SETIT|nr:hypothetical protein SETIT_6G191400v2 [Setaria italica]
MLMFALFCYMLLIICIALNNIFSQVKKTMRMKKPSSCVTGYNNFYMKRLTRFRYQTFEVTMCSSFSQNRFVTQHAKGNKVTNTSAWYHDRV